MDSESTSDQPEFSQQILISGAKGNVNLASRVVIDAANELLRLYGHGARFTLQDHGDHLVIHLRSNSDSGPESISVQSIEVPASGVDLKPKAFVPYKIPE